MSLPYAMVVVFMGAYLAGVSSTMGMFRGKARYFIWFIICILVMSYGMGAVIASI